MCKGNGLNQLQDNVMTKKALYATAFMLLTAFAARSQTVPHYVYIPQYIHVPSGPSKPWDGHSLVALYAGTGFFSQPSESFFSPLSYTPYTPFTVSFRYGAEKNFSPRFFWGMHGEVSFYRFGYDYAYDGDSLRSYSPQGISSAGHDIECSERLWTLSAEEGFTIGYCPSRALSLSLTAGICLDFLTHYDRSERYVNRLTGAVADEDSDSDLSLFKFSTMGFLFRAEAQYFLTGGLFLSLAAKAQVHVRTGTYDDPFGTNRYSLLLGVGYTSFRRPSTSTDD